MITIPDSVTDPEAPDGACPVRNCGQPPEDPRRQWCELHELAGRLLAMGRATTWQDALQLAGGSPQHVRFESGVRLLEDADGRPAGVSGRTATATMTYRLDPNRPLT
ncbi:hypothetical protein [Candidatus Blastococcus massiliensis]|uniref:hypothetical protein n=1 Tax=Candidatus Blastococcus massiliensis TaxID=1470358 RepID=UPI0004B76284|nr:hypothetical protein [Candidatus Blastococcus massiliensis]